MRYSSLYATPCGVCVPQLSWGIRKMAAAKAQYLVGIFTSVTSPNIKVRNSDDKHEEMSWEDGGNSGFDIYNILEFFKNDPLVPPILGGSLVFGSELVPLC
jgi:hypothetical protein